MLFLCLFILIKKKGNQKRKPKPSSIPHYNQYFSLLFPLNPLPPSLSLPLPTKQKQRSLISPLLYQLSPMASSSSKLVPFLLFLVTIIMGMAKNSVGAQTPTWCVARSDASNMALQTALDYACGSGADCVPLQSNGLCFLPNTLQAHASYAFNSYYQKKARAPGSCDFAGTATIAQSDPSYGSCVYPSSASSAGGGGANIPSTTPPMINPNVPPTTTTPIYGSGGNTGGLTPGMNSPFPDNSRAPSEAVTTWLLVFCSSILIMSLIIIS